MRNDEHWRLGSPPIRDRDKAPQSPVGASWLASRWFFNAERKKENRQPKGFFNALTGESLWPKFFRPRPLSQLSRFGNFCRLKFARAVAVLRQASQFTCDSGSCCLGSEARLRLQGGRLEGEQSAHRRTRSVGVISAGAGAGAGSCDGASAPRRRAWCRQALRGKRFGCASSCRVVEW